MRALSLWQPWASLIAAGEKRVETRSWSTNYRGIVAIHAAQKWNGELRQLAYDLGAEDPGGLPRGKVVALARLADCAEMTPELIDAQTERERQLGVWLPGRFAWVLKDIQPLSEPLPLIGRQGLFRIGCVDSWSILERAAKEAIRSAAAGIEGPHGPCAFCSYPDKRHRMWDTVAGRYRAGDSLGELASDYRESETWVRYMLALEAEAVARG